MIPLESVTVFKNQWLPERATLVGYAALIDFFNLDVPLPAMMSATSIKHRQYEQDGWSIYTPKHMPQSTLAGHLTFALKYEGLDLLVLKRVFQAVGPEAVAELVAAEPTGSYARRVWFLYEWLLDERLPIEDVSNAVYVDALDTSLQFGITGENSKRHRVRNNLPGTNAFCPLVRRTKSIITLVDEKLSSRAHAAVGAVPADIVNRAAAFFLLKDTKSSFEIEGENPNNEKLRRWGNVVLEAGRHPLSVEELERLQRIVLEGERFLHLGIRTEEGFIGEHHRGTHEPVPDHVSAKAEDLPSLVQGLIEYDRRGRNAEDAVIVAAPLAFGFVFIHPFADGNGRIHRYLIHHVLAEAKFNPPKVLFPVSSAMTDDLDAYRRALEIYSRPTLNHINWTSSPDGNVVIHNDTADLYRYFDATAQTEYLYRCVERTINVDLPNETAFLQSYDRFKRSLKAMVDMPQRLENLLFNMIHDNGGSLPKGRRKKEFAQLTDAEVERIEQNYREAFPADDQSADLTP